MNIVQFKIKSLIFKWNYSKRFKSKIDRAIMFCYQELYKRATPAANFMTLLDNAIKYNNRDISGRYIIPFRDYEIEGDKLDKIINLAYKVYMKKNPYKEEVFRSSIYLGCSPKTKMK